MISFFTALLALPFSWRGFSDSTKQLYCIKMRKILILFKNNSVWVLAFTPPPSKLLTSVGPSYGNQIVLFYLLTRSGRNQITVVAFQPVQLAQASLLQKNQALQNVFYLYL